MSGKVALERQAVHIRHVRRRQPGETGGVDVGGDFYVAQPIDPLNGEQGWQSGTYEPHEGEEGSWATSLPNSNGSDGILHRKRFLALTNDDFRNGDEFVEIYEGDPPGGRLLWAGMVTDWEKRSSVELRGTCALSMLKHARETRAGFWTGHAPRDVWEYYTRVWQTVTADGFSAQAFTYSTSEQTTADGRWEYKRGEDVAGQSVCQLRPAAGALSSDAAYLTGVETFAPADTLRWRFELEIERSAFENDNFVRVELTKTNETESLFQLEMFEARTFVVSAGNLDLNLETTAGVTHFEIEGDRRWIYVYVNGTLKAVLPGGAGAGAYKPKVYVGGDPGTAAVYVRVRHISLRAHQPLLLRGADKGDYHLPGEPTPGGLQASYYSEQDTVAKVGATYAYLHTLKPIKEPSVRRAEWDITLAGTDWPPAFQGNAAFSVRLTGAIYLDLAATDLKLGLGVRGRGRLWVGKTRFGEQVVDFWPQAGGITSPLAFGPFLRSVFGEVSGWYPIVIEYSSHDATPELTVVYDDGTGNNWSLGSGALGVRTSPLGCFAQQVQGDSHYEMLMALRDSFGYQFTCEPRSLESGEFPGQVVPRIRLGRDTDHVLDDLGAVEPVAVGSAGDAVDELIVDGSGISDPEQAAQQSYGALNFPALAAGRVMIHSEQESLSDITDLALLKQRAQSLLALRSGVWEEVQAQPEDKSRQLTDTFPLTGELAEFDWAVGDGLRLDFEHIDVVDEIPRQIGVVAWPIRPDGRGVPAGSFRQRPRNFVQVLRRLARLAQAPQRNYQGQLGAVPGSLAAHPTTAIVLDEYSKVNLPADLSRVVRAELVVQTKSDGSAMTIEVNGTNRLTFTKADRYDITAYLAQASPGEPRMYARATSGTGSAQYALELLVAV